MNVEQVARDFVGTFDRGDILQRVTPDASVSGGVLPSPMPATEAARLVAALRSAFPDLRFQIEDVKVDGNIATVDTMWGGTNSGPFPVPIPGIAPLPPTGRKVWVKDTYVVTIRGDKVAHMEMRSPVDGGMPGALAQLGVKVPGV